MKQTYVKYLMVAVLTGGFLFTSCRTARETTAQYEVTKVEGSMITIDSVWDTTPNVKATEILKPYKEKVDAMMYEVIGTSAMKMDKGAPESLLSDLVAGVVLQFLFYGITSSWVLVAVALIFVQMQSYAESLYMDELSGLYNRRYFNAVLAEKKIASHKSLYGIMMDVNDFKCINDNLGHSTGDKAICTLGNILIRSIPDDGMAIRYAGDEFIVLLSGVDTERVLATMEEINHNLSRFNESGIEPFHLSVSMGYTEFGTEDDAETFLMHMDEKMYEEKRKYHMRKKSAGLENKV